MPSLKLELKRRYNNNILRIIKDCMLTSFQSYILYNIPIIIFKGNLINILFTNITKFWYRLNFVIMLTKIVLFNC